MTTRHPLWRILALFAALTLVAAACGDDEPDDTVTGDVTDDADVTDDDPDDTDDTDDASEGDLSLAGMTGTTPLVELSSDFTDRLDEIDPDLAGTYNYAAESYDAVMVITLAAIAAGTDGLEMADAINEVTRNGEVCTTFAECRTLAEAGTDFDYDGVSGPMDFSGNGEPTVASFGVLTFGEDNRIDESQSRFIEAQAPEASDVPQEDATGNRPGNGILKIGTLLPETGSLAFLGPPEIAGVQLAIDEVNDNGGFNGQDVELVTGDSGDTSTDIASQTVDRLLQADVDAIIGAASSGVSLTVIDAVTSAGVVMFSPANTSPTFSDYDDRGLYFRNAPSDILQGNVLGEVIAEDGNATVGIIVLDDPYGVPLARQLTDSLEEAGSEVVATVTYDPQATSFDAEVGQLAAEDPEAIVVIGFNESSRILTTMIEQGVGPQDVNVYGVDGNMGNALGEDFEAGE